MKVNELLENAKDKVCSEEGWQEAYDALHDLSWEEAVKHPKAVEWVCWYAEFIIKGRWEAAEPIIMKSAEWSYWYTRKSFNGRWEAAEPIIMKSAKWAYLYALNVIKDKWPEAEPFIIQNTLQWEFYKRAFNL